jgi:isobutyryl-CoA mutase small subunit
VLELFKEHHAEDVLVFGGGIVPRTDIAALTELGVATVFAPGTTTQEIVDWVRENVPDSELAES